MADQQSGPSDPNTGPSLAESLRIVLNETLTDDALLSQLAQIRSRHDIQSRMATTLGEPHDTTLDRAHLLSLLVTAANGEAELPTQSVLVEYLRTEQKLLIPAPLGYCLTNAELNESRPVDELVTRYYRVAISDYAAIKHLVTNARDFTAIRVAIDAIQMPIRIDITNSWIHSAIPMIRQGVHDRSEDVTIVMSTLSAALQLNCDIRDVGFLTTASARLLDSAWANISAQTRDRLLVKIRPYTLQNIAALNYNAVSRNPLAAWARAYGVATGILPHSTSVTQVEYAYTYEYPSVEDRLAVTNFETRVRFNLHSVSMNILAMFGLLHLAKDHTFKSADSNMERICTSWVLTLRTLLPVDDMDAIRASLEPICRTCAHPFGLAQTYWLARMMHKYGLLSSPLMIRISQTPPPVQRIMIVRAATREWESMAAGKLLNELFRRHLEHVYAEYDRIKSIPPAFSGLYRLYAVDNMAHPTQEATDACNLLMPAVYGFAMALHVDDDRKKDGLALALSLENVARDHKVLARSFEAIWSTYLDSVSKLGLAEFINESARLTGMELGTGM